MPTFTERLAAGPVILLDGGLATQLEAQGADLSGPLWSASLIADAPEQIRHAHDAFLAAGAECITTASYQASREGYAALGVDAAQADALMRRAVAIAREACAAFTAREALTAQPEHSGQRWVAASVGPWGATRCDGSEYTGRYAIDTAGLAAFHGERLAVLDAAGADVLACETIPNLDEAAVLARLLRDVRTPAWVSFCCRDGQHLSDGTPIAQAAGLFAGHPRVVAVGVNCVAPGHVSALLAHLRGALPDMPLVAYPNAGECWDAAHRTWSGTTSDLTSLVPDWVRLGARLIGGCCRVTPAQISALADRLRRLQAPAHRPRAD